MSGLVFNSSCGRSIEPARPAGFFWPPVLLIGFGYHFACIMIFLLLDEITFFSWPPGRSS